MENVLTIGVPKGSLEQSTLALFARAGFRFYGSERLLWLTSNDTEIKPVLLRPQEIPVYVSMGKLDCGLAGWDWIVENDCNGSVRMLADLCYSKRSFKPVRWVLAVAENSDFHTIGDLKRCVPSVRVSTELQKVTESWLAERGVSAQVQFSWGATEAKVPFFCDAIVECTETGSSLQANGLRIIDTILESTTRFFANNDIYKNDDWKRTKMENIALLLKSCLAADAKECIHLQVPRTEKGVLKNLVPSVASLTVWDGDDELAFFEIFIDRELSRDLVPVLARNGAERISIASPNMLYE
jgi:ATP phosphoribosyltransferase